MRKRTHRELVAILSSVARGLPEDLEAVVAELKSESADRLGEQRSRRRSAAVDKALAAVTDDRSHRKLGAQDTSTHHACGGTR
ncbi:hypothetical protein ACIGO9_15000 [Nocardia asteroides]|uniref:hypothetical protein n=1 Tax=Nocardia asteroides TaxID=1824 RepID=UPI0037C71F7C